MTESAVPREGQDGTIYGYGAGANSAPAEGQFKASVEVIGGASDAFSGPATKVRGVSGAANHGDSGGPLMINGVVVGACSTGDVDDPGADTQATANYANIENSRSWIEETTGI